MKILKLIKKLIMSIIVIIFFVFAITITLTMLNINKYGISEIGTVSLVPIKEEVSSKNYEKGDLVLVERKLIDNLVVGDEIFVYKIRKDGGVSIDIGIIGEIHGADEAVSFENGATYSLKFIIGKADKVYSDNIGHYLSILQSKWGFLFIILVPSFLIFVYELYALVIEVKYGKDESNVGGGN